MKADALIKNIKGWVEQLAAELKEGQTQGFLAFLEKAGRFHRYSARNVMLIHQQRPEATLVAGVNHPTAKAGGFQGQSHAD
ncbi:hypothetical protein [Allomeiothermus silvanus]|uniref:hypothetical protein n=1 Tax=Allomeiothermus silvanus TaxID=52022 RepID=UPI000303C829|nr:hypothetical protein [Allomeiothermus silvanus]